MSTFGLVIPGRPVSRSTSSLMDHYDPSILVRLLIGQVDTSFQQVDTNKFLITIANAESINHVVLFLTGLTQLPPDAAGCIYFSLPDPNAPPTWHYLGYLTNEKASAIYKLTNFTQSKLRANNELNNNNNNNSINSSSPPSMNGLMNFNYAQAPVMHVAQIGISIEPVSIVTQMVPVIEATASKTHLFTEFINKTASNLFNYCSSFSRSASDLASQVQNPSAFQILSNTQYVPLSTIQTWYENYTRRLGNDPNFWKTLNQ